VESRRRGWLASVVGRSLRSRPSLLLVNPIDVSPVGNAYISDLTEAAFTNVTSTTVTIDAGAAPIPGGGIEVRSKDIGWGADNNRNLIGRFTTSSFSLTSVCPIFLKEL
jgi:hypothetical protein